MPELAEVESARRAVYAVAVGKRILKCKVEQDTKVYDKVAPNEFAKYMTGATLTNILRHGKQLWMEVDKKPKKFPTFHFAMTGNFLVRPADTGSGRKVQKMVSLVGGGDHGKLIIKERKRNLLKGIVDTGEDDEEKVQEIEDRKEEVASTWPPKFWKCILQMDDGTEVAFVNARRFGRIRLVDSMDGILSKLGFDPYLNMAPLDHFVKVLGKRSLPIKALLLDQKFAAGIGNWLADEILYQAHIHPETVTSTLNEKQVQAIHTAMKYVVDTAVNCRADANLYPDDFLFFHRWDKGGRVAQVLANGDRLDYITVGGRTSCYVPARQKKTTHRLVEYEWTEHNGKSTRDRLKEEEEVTTKTAGRQGATRTTNKVVVKIETEDTLRELQSSPSKKLAAKAKAKARQASSASTTPNGTRRSARIRS
eukprot:Clim_evm18s2 gene=Clim_evmTU18s2